MEKIFAVLQNEFILNTFSDELSAQEYKRLTTGATTVIRLKMNSKLYKRAYKFLKLRASGGEPFEAFEKLNFAERELLIKFLKYNHQIKFI